jgi:hypothetical protein
MVSIPIHLTLWGEALHLLGESPQVLITGGLPPLIEKPCAADGTYNKLFKRVVTQNAKYYQRFPEDVQRVREIVS